MNFLSTGSRTTVIRPIAIIFAVWIIKEQVIPYKRIFLLIVGSVLVLGMLGNFRQSLTFQGDLNWQLLTDVNGAVSATLGSKDELGELELRQGAEDGTLAIIGNVPQKEGFLYGRSYLEILAAPIPRAIWADKPRGMGALVGEAFFRTDAGVPPGVVGEAYWNFHIPGVLLIYFLYGIFHRGLMRAYLFYAFQPGAIVLYITTLFLFSPSSSDMIKFIIVMSLNILFLRFLGIIKFRYRKSDWNYVIASQSPKDRF